MEVFIFSKQVTVHSEPCHSKATILRSILLLLIVRFDRFTSLALWCVFCFSDLNGWFYGYLIITCWTKRRILATLCDCSCYLYPWLTLKISSDRAEIMCISFFYSFILYGLFIYERLIYLLTRYIWLSIWNKQNYEINILFMKKVQVTFWTWMSKFIDYFYSSSSIAKLPLN